LIQPIAVAAQAVRAQQQNIGLQVTVEPDTPVINADPDRMVQVLGNVLDNALRHTPDGGNVVCRVTHELNSASTPVIFSIADTGPGIAPEDLPHVFERFYRADKSRQRDNSGSGLGLAIARSIVEAHGGRMWAESTSGSGTRIFVTLPGDAAAP